MFSKRESFTRNIKTLATFVGVISMIIFILLVAYGIFSDYMEFYQRIAVLTVSFAFITPVGFMSLLLYGMSELIEIQCEQKEVLTAISIGRQNNISNDELPKL